MTAQPARIPFVNLDRQYEEIKPEIDAAIKAVLESKAFIQGPFVEQFERSFAAYLRIDHVIGCANGTIAISLALEALGVGSGDEVITVSHTFAATASAIRHVGAVPVFVDIDAGSYCIDVSKIEQAITARTKAILPVHLYGTPCEIEPLMELARRHNLLVIEDAAQAHGARYDGKSVGTFGAAATFSFYPGKNLGAYGDAGAVVTNDPAVAARLRKLRDHGRQSKYVHDMIGYNHRMDGIQGAVLSAKLAQLEKWNARRRTLAARYDSALRQRGFKTIVPPREAVPVYHLYVVEVGNRDEVASTLKAAGVDTGVHYPVPLHQQPAFEPWSSDCRLPVTERVAERVISLPICGSLHDDEQDRVMSAFFSCAQQ